MADENNPGDYKPDSEQGNPDRAKDGISEGQPGAIQQPDPKDTGNGPNEPPKAAVTVRFWHALWRKRIFFRHHHADGPNWAERTSMYITGGILLAAILQAFIYLKQAGIMERSLEQNQQTIALNTGQLAIAGRNAKTSEDTLAEIKTGATDTHDLAIAATDQAAAAKLQVGEMKKQGTQTHELAVQAGNQATAAKIQADNAKELLKQSAEAFQVSETPYVVLGRKDGVMAEFRDAKNGSDSPGIEVYLQNSGHLPAINVCVTVTTPDPTSIPKLFENNSLTRMKERSGPNRYAVFSEGNCVDVGGDSIAIHYVPIPKPFGQADIERAKASRLPFIIGTVVQYCTPFGEYRCREALLKYEQAPFDGFVHFGQDQSCSELYGRFPERYVISASQEYVKPCDKPGEAEQRRKDEDRAWQEDQDAKAKARQKP